MKDLYLTADEMSARRGNVPSLDGLRAISISIVLLAHFVSGKIFPGGLGVYIFFVISGFLITRLLLAEQDATRTVSLKAFYVRRICRLYPVIIVFSCVVTLMDIGLHRAYDLLEPASALGYFANYYYVYLNTHGIPQKMPFEIFWLYQLKNISTFYFRLPSVC
ncbi:acyltransferase family protein [Rhodopila sp.]|uniref:acyltransferase family protein n=1 Tax=Rhodopila sp. TaxID=2480087 RepID=UPI003D13C08D